MSARLSMSRTPKPTNAPDSLIQLLDLNQLRHVNSLQDKLCNPLSNLHLKLLVRMVEQEDFDFSAVLCSGLVSARKNRINHRSHRYR